MKKDLVGAGHTLYAKPWTREIFLQAERFPSPRLRHELAHVFAGAFGDPLFGIAFRWKWMGPLPVPIIAMGLVEGLAEAADWTDPDGSSTIHQDAAAMIADGLAPPLASVVGAGFSAQAGPRAYTMAGSFCAFLLETRGPERLRALYRSAGNFLDVYRTPLASLEEEWRQFLAKQAVSSRDKARASEQFRRPAIFKKVCARELAARVAEARGLERAAPGRAVRLLVAACHDDPHEPSYRLELAQARAFAGDTRGSLEALGRLAADADLTDPMHAQVASLAAEIDFHAGDFANATAEQRRYLDLATEDAERRLGLARLRGLATPAARATLGRALFGDALGMAGNDPLLTFHLMSEYTRLHPADRVGPYLLGRQLVGRAPEEALPFLRRACDDEAPLPARPGEDALPPVFERECRRLIAEAAYRLGEYERARAALTLLAGEAEGRGRAAPGARHARAGGLGGVAATRARWRRAGRSSARSTHRLNRRPRGPSKAATGRATKGVRRMSAMSGEMRRRSPAAILLGRLAVIATLVCFCERRGARADPAPAFDHAGPADGAGWATRPLARVWRHGATAGSAAAGRDAVVAPADRCRRAARRAAPAGAAAGPSLPPELVLGRHRHRPRDGRRPPLRLAVECGPVDPRHPARRHACVLAAGSPSACSPPSPRARVTSRSRSSSSTCSPPTRGRSRA